MRSGTHSYIRDVSALKCRCDVDPVSGCWSWRGATSSDGLPRIHAFDHDRGAKVTMTGGRAAWNIAFDRAPRPGMLVFRSCGTKLCVSPYHLREIASRQEMGDAIRLAGFRKGTAIEARRANQRLACIAAGKPTTPPEVVMAIRQAPASITAKDLAAMHGIAHQTASRIRRGDSHRHLLPQTEAEACPA